VYLQQQLDSEVIASFPVNGAGDMGPLISLFRGWGVPFVVLLDADAQGRREKKRYVMDYDLSEDQVLTLDEARTELNNQSFEAIFGDDVRKAIGDKSVGRGKSLKEDAAQLFQLLLASGDTGVKLPKTLETFRSVHEAVLERLRKQ
jgi:hypothetical protein